MLPELTTLPGLDPYDHSLLLQEGDLKFAYNADGLRELQMVSSIENLAQGLSITFETPLGSDIFNQLFGFDLYSILQGGHNLAVTKQLIRAHVVKTIDGEDRILRIEELYFDDDPRFRELNPDVDHEEVKRLRKASRRWKLNATILPITGEATAVPVEINAV